MNDNVSFEQRLEAFIPALNAFVADHYAKNYKNLSPSTYTVDKGPKYLRIVENRAGGGVQPNRSCYCFLDYQGNIYKSASWKAPAKHIRGSIFDANFSLG